MPALPIGFVFSSGGARFVPFWLVVCVSLSFPGWAFSQSFGAYRAPFTFQELFSQADRFGPVEGVPPAATAYRNDVPEGYVFIASDIVPSIGYSGKPIELVVGLDLRGTVVGVKLIGHYEPILLAGIPDKKLFDFVDRYLGVNLLQRLQQDKSGEVLDAISGATVTAIVIDAAIMRASLKVAKARGIVSDVFSSDQAAPATLADLPFETKTWEALRQEGAVHRLRLTHADVDQTFQAMGVPERQPFEAWGAPEEIYIDLYAALVTQELIGRNLLGEAEYRNLQKTLQPGQHAILLVANGRYSFRGSGFVRGGIFDRIQMTHNDASLLFRDSHYKRLGKLAVEGAPTFSEVALFSISEAFSFDPTAPWRIDLIAQRSTSPLEKVYTKYMLTYQLPERYINRPPVPSRAMAANMAGVDGPLWQSVWNNRIPQIGILVLALGLLTLVFFFQGWVVKRPVFLARLHLSFLLFTTLWIGFYAQAQLSVVNVLTFLNALITEFHWEVFLMEPLIFILWSGVAISLLFWGRGPFCGWLCPFGALQELINKGANLLGITQVKLSFYWHERLWSLKYILFLVLLAFSFHSLGEAEWLAEVEPFKTVVLLGWMRPWPFVVYALVLLGAGLFMHRFFCRYLCPLGAALAIPGKMRLFEWLKRRKQCGAECQFCASICHVQAIHPEGHINPNECFYCLACQQVYYDTHLCPPLKQRWEKQQRRVATRAKLAQESSTSKS